MKEDFYLSSLMVSKICHDLCGSSSTLAFSLEEIFKDEETNKDAIGLALKSAKVFTNRIKYFRGAFGISVFNSGTSLTQDLRSLIFDLCYEKDINLDWLKKYDELLEEYLNNINIKLFLNIFLIIFNNIPKSATINVVIGSINADEIAIILIVQGYKITLKDEVINILNGKGVLNKANPRNINLYFTYFLKQKADSIIEINNNCNNEGLKIAFSLKK